MPEMPHRTQREWPAAGWYPDQFDGAGERYWNGFAWDLGDLKAEPHRDWADGSPLPTVIDHEVGPEYSTGSRVAMGALWLAVILIMVAFAVAGGWYGFILAGFIGAIASVFSLMHRQRTRRGMGLVPLVTAAAVILLVIGVPAAVIDSGSVGTNTQFAAAGKPVAPVTAPTAQASQRVAVSNPSPAVQTPTHASTPVRSVPSPVASQNFSGAYPPGVTAVCEDGHFATSTVASATCVQDGGVAHWVQQPVASTGDTSAQSATVSYANCAAVRAAGKAPLLRDQPGYASHLDRDGDGVACE
jgi:hypothetical protein